MRIPSIWVAVAIALVGYGGITAQAGEASWPQLKPADLAACQHKIADFHKKEIAYIVRLMAPDCDPSNKDRIAINNCATYKQWLQKSIATDDMAWWFKGNGSCEASDYPCFGPDLFNDVGPGKDDQQRSLDLIHTMAQHKPKGAQDNQMDLYSMSFVIDKCVAKVWLAKYEAQKHGGKLAQAPGAPGVSGGSGDDNLAKAPSVSGSAGDSADGDDESSDTGPTSAKAGSGGGSATASLPDGSSLPQVQQDAEAMAHSGECKEALAKYNAEMEASNANAPSPEKNQGAGGLHNMSQAGGARDLYQMGMYITDSLLKVLDKYCKGEPEYAMYAPTKSSYNTALRGCNALSADGGGSCRPLKLW